MPHYYHTKNIGGRSKARVNVADESMLASAIDNDELARIVVKIAKTWTDKTWMQIAEEAKTSVKHVKALWKDVKKSEEYALESAVEPEIKQQLREYDLMKVELMKAWHDSKSPQTKEKVEDGYTSKGDILKNTKEVIDRDPKVEYLSEIRMINQERRKLLGIEKHVEINFNQQNNNQFNFESAGESLVSADHNSFIKKREGAEGPSLEAENKEVLSIPEKN